MANEILQGAIKSGNGTAYTVDVIDQYPSPDKTIVVVSGLNGVDEADDYRAGLQSLNHKSEKYLEGVQKALDILTAE